MNSEVIVNTYSMTCSFHGAPMILSRKIATGFGKVLLMEGSGIFLMGQVTFIIYLETRGSFPYSSVVPIPSCLELVPLSRSCSFR